MMKASFPQAAGSSVTESLINHLAEIAKSIEQALSALSRHSLSEMEESLWTQERLSALIRRAVQDLRVTAVSPPEAEALRSALMHVARVNRCYDLVIREAACTNAILRAALSNSHPQHSAGPGSSYGSLSFEI